ncbi:uncharacterized protein [Palaemon carinicauda]|uniref:uncharacterized protein n=1 Tax=Palaemon carinicauda TaxID=392227 RepID=UPI0035B5C734
MSECIEQRYCINFDYTLDATQVQTIQKIQQAFGNEVMGITQIKEWYNRFRQGQTLVESKPRSGRPSTSRNEEFIENVRRIVEDDRRITINEITEEVGISTVSEMWEARNWQLHHDNAPAHSPQLIQSNLAKNSTPLVRNPPYSPDMAPCDFWLFPKLKTTLKGKRFESREDIMRKTTAELYIIPMSTLQRCYQQWPHWWENCVHSQGEYFEDD